MPVVNIQCALVDANDDYVTTCKQDDSEWPLVANTLPALISMVEESLDLADIQDCLSPDGTVVTDEGDYRIVREEVRTVSMIPDDLKYIKEYLNT